MPCHEPQLGGLILRYEMRELSEAEELRFESHLLGCEHCYENLRALARFAGILLKHPEEAGRYLRTLYPPDRHFQSGT